MRLPRRPEGETRSSRLVRIVVLALLAGLAIWGSSMWRLSRHFSDEAKMFADLELEAKLSYSERDDTLAGLDRDSLKASIRPEAGDAPTINWLKQMREKYERAARYPWLPVAPDPPEPK